jgi:hypothetical protein
MKSEPAPTAASPAPKLHAPVLWPTSPMSGLFVMCGPTDMSSGCAAGQLHNPALHVPGVLQPGGAVQTVPSAAELPTQAPEALHLAMVEQSLEQSVSIGFGVCMQAPALQPALWHKSESPHSQPFELSLSQLRNPVAQVMVQPVASHVPCVFTHGQVVTSGGAGS